MTPSVCNLLANLPSARAAEMSEILLSGRGIRFERIVSLGQTSPEGFWYEQNEAEWVMVLTGRARLTIAGEPEDLLLGPGDTAFLPPKCRHRVAWTDPDQPTVWLALLIGPELRVSASGPLLANNVHGNPHTR
jgi:cupin 2 domain-containing protein